MKLGEGGGGCRVVDSKNGLPDADSIFFNKVASHQSFFLIVYQTRTELVTERCNRAQQHHDFRVFHLLEKLVRFLLAAV